MSKNNKFKFLSTFLLTSGISSLTSCGSKVSFFTIKNNKDIEITFCNRGASIYSIKYKDQFVTYHPKNQSDFLTDNFYYGRALGRVAGRIKDGKINVSDKDYQLEVNETGGAKHNTLHGGTMEFLIKILLTIKAKIMKRIMFRLTIYLKMVRLIFRVI